MGLQSAAWKRYKRAADIQRINRQIATWEQEKISKNQKFDLRSAAIYQKGARLSIQAQMQIDFAVLMGNDAEDMFVREVLDIRIQALADEKTAIDQVKCETVIKSRRKFVVFGNSCKRSPKNEFIRTLEKRAAVSDINPLLEHNWPIYSCVRPDSILCYFILLTNVIFIISYIISPFTFTLQCLPFRVHDPILVLCVARANSGYCY